MTTHDRRLNPDVPTGAQCRPMRLATGHAPLRPRPAPDVGIDTEILFGETLAAFDEMEGWAYVQADRDRYVGWISANALEPVRSPATHRLSALRSYVYAGPSIKVPEPTPVSQGALFTVAGFAKDFAVLDGGGYVFAAHLEPVDARAEDFVALAEAHLGAAYLWGGRTSIGLDCSALVQNALAGAGIACPRDTDLQEAHFRQDLPITPDFAGLRRGDLVFWKGHVGIMRDTSELIHANGHHMAVASEPLAEAAARILTKSFGPVTSIKRLPSEAAGSIAGR